MKKVLLDENLPVKLKFRLQDTCEIYTVRDKAWNALENGDLLDVMEKEQFDYLITSDNNLQFQQNVNKYSFGLIVLNTVNNNYETILPLVDSIKNILQNKRTLKLKIIG